MKTNFIERKDGKKRATVRVEFVVEEAEVLWLMEKAGLTEAQALERIRVNAKGAINEHRAWHTWLIEDGKLSEVRSDDVSHVDDDCEGCAVFRGER